MERTLSGICLVALLAVGAQMASKT